MLWLFGMYLGAIGALLYFNYLNSERRMNRDEIDRLTKKQQEEMDRYHAFMQMAEDADDLKEYEVGDKWEKRAKAALDEAERINQRLLDL